MKKESKLLSIRVQCCNCNKEVELTDQGFSFSSHSDECDACGSHGEIEIYITCTECQKSSDIEVSSW